MCFRAAGVEFELALLLPEAPPAPPAEDGPLSFLSGAMLKQSLSMISRLGGSPDFHLDSDSWYSRWAGWRSEAAYSANHRRRVVFSLRFCFSPEQTRFFSTSLAAY